MNDKLELVHVECKELEANLVSAHEVVATESKIFMDKTIQLEVR